MLPTGSCDCHAHVFPPEFPPPTRAAYEPPAGEIADYLALSRRLGFSRCVLVTPSIYETDNASLLHALGRLGSAARGVANIDPSVPEETIAQLSEAGVRGARLVASPGHVFSLDRLAATAARIAPFGWHLDLLLARLGDLDALAPQIAKAPCPVVLDHLARTHGAGELRSDSFRGLLRLLGSSDHVWVKLSSWYRLSQTPDHADMAPVAGAILAARPDRVVWGSNWPHAGHRGAMPCDVDLTRQALAWVGEANAQAVFVANPAILYGFGPDGSCLASS